MPKHHLSIYPSNHFFTQKEPASFREWGKYREISLYRECEIKFRSVWPSIQQTINKTKYCEYKNIGNHKPSYVTYSGFQSEIEVSDHLNV